MEHNEYGEKRQKLKERVEKAKQLSCSALPAGSPAGCHFASDHDYAGAIRKGRCHYECPKCGKDISLEYVMHMDAVKRAETIGGTVTRND